jgi:tagatose-1,6-bisphosphate aldolase
MNEVWYKIVTPQATVEIKDYETAKRFETNGANVERIYKYKDLDRRDVNEARKAKILRKYGL